MVWRVLGRFLTEYLQPILVRQFFVGPIQVGSASVGSQAGRLHVPKALSRGQPCPPYEVLRRHRPKTVGPHGRSSRESTMSGCSTAPAHAPRGNSRRGAALRIPVPTNCSQRPDGFCPLWTLYTDEGPRVADVVPISTKGRGTEGRLAREKRRIRSQRDDRRRALAASSARKFECPPPQVEETVLCPSMLVWVRRLAFPLACLLLLGTNIALQVQLRQARTRLAAYRARELRGFEVARGTRVPKIRGVGPNGRQVEVDPAAPHTRTLLLAFSTACVYSQQNLPNWKRVIEESRGNHGPALQVILIDLTSIETAKYISANGLAGLQVIARAEAETIAACNLSMTPQTILIADGEVKQVWSGVLNSQSMRSIHDALASM